MRDEVSSNQWERLLIARFNRFLPCASFRSGCQNRKYTDVAQSVRADDL